MAKIDIGGTLHSTALGPTEVESNVVTNADEVLDVELNKKQDTINSELTSDVSDLKTAVGTGGSVDSRIAAAKTEILGDASTDYNTLGKVEDSIESIDSTLENAAYLGTDSGSAVITGFDPQSDTLWKKAQVLSTAQKNQVKVNLGLDSDFEVVYSLYRALNQSDIVVGTLPVTGNANTIYRVPGESSYTDWMYYNNSWVEMATYDNAIDDEPTAGSDNLVKSGGIVSAINDVKITDGSIQTEAELSFVDEENNCIAQFKNGHIKTKNFDSTNTVTSEEVQSSISTAITAFSEKVSEVDNEEDDDESLSFVDENFECALQVKDGHIKTKNFDSSNIQIQKKVFASIGIDKLSVSGTSSKSDNVINLASGISNKAYLSGGFECAHWDMFAKFKCGNSGLHFAMGKDNTLYGAWVEIKIDNGDSKYVLYNNGKNQQYSSVVEGELDFNLNIGEEYCLHVFFDVTTTKVIGFELFGEFDEYFTHTFTATQCNGYGNPFFYSEYDCVVRGFSLSNQRFYDIKNAKCAVWGHSYVEGDSLGSNRDKTFTNLLANAIGQDKVFNFGLGGDTFQGVYNKILNELGIVQNIQYGLVCVGANDGGTSSQLIERINQITSKLVKNNIVPIVFTIAPINYAFNTIFRDTNAYIREHFLYVDMEQVFVDVDVLNGSPTDANIKQSLYLSDKVHPTVQGHQYIFNRIKMDCPFLF